MLVAEAKGLEHLAVAALGQGDGDVLVVVLDQLLAEERHEAVLVRGC